MREFDRIDPHTTADARGMRPVNNGRPGPSYDKDAWDFVKWFVAGIGVGMLGIAAGFGLVIWVLVVRS